MDGRISALSAQIAELSKKIETVSSGSGGSNWAGELAFALHSLTGSFVSGGHYNPNMWTVSESFHPNVKLVNPTNRDCIMVVTYSNFKSPGYMFSSSHGDIPFTELEKFCQAIVPVNKGGYIRNSTDRLLRLRYLIVKN